jgi:3-oxoacyl-[acyl-carrier-protein] synthase-3
MEAQGIPAGLLVTAETYSKLIAPSDRATAPLFGDAAAATLLTRDPTYRLGAFTFGTDGTRGDALIARGSAIRRDTMAPLYMDGRGIFAFVMQQMPSDIAACLAANALQQSDIDAWVFHQASRHMIESLATRAGIPKDRLIIEMEDVGNTTSSSIPIALDRRILTGPHMPRRIFLSGFGVGLSWASTVITRNDEAGP